MNLTPLAALLRSPYRPLADIPNTQGFRFIGLTKDGREVACTVTRRADGSHTLADNAFSSLAKWRNL